MWNILLASSGHLSQLCTLPLRFFTVSSHWQSMRRRGKKKSLNSHKHNLAKSKTWLCYHSKSKTALWWLLRRNHPSCNQDHTDHLFHIICVMPSFTLPNIPSPSLFICFDRYTNLILLVNGTRLSVHKTSTPLKVCWIHLVHDFGLHTW